MWCASSVGERDCLRLSHLYRYTGGPNSNKGKAAEILCRRYGFRLLNLEQLLIDYLRELYGDEDDVMTARDLIKRGEEDGETLTMVRCPAG